MDVRHLDVDGLRIAVRDTGGSARPIVLLHGNSVSSRAFDKQLSGPLAREFRVIAIDFPGHGSSASAADPDAAYSFPTLCNVVGWVARELKLTHAVWVGWSLGGHVLLDCADQLPDPAGLCIFGAPPLGSPPAMDRAFLPHPALADLWKENLTDDDIIKRVAVCLRPGAPRVPDLEETVRRTDPKFRPSLLKSFASGAVRDEVTIVRDLRIPLAVLHGRDDQAINGEYIDTLTMPTLWRKRVHRIDNAGHTPQWEAPEAFDQLVGDFAREVSA